MMDFKTISEIVQNFVVALAVIVGGSWTLYRFLIQRAYETALEIDLLTHSYPYKDEKFIVFFDAVLTNKGQRRLCARPKRYIKNRPRPIYEDMYETIYHAALLQIKLIKPYQVDGFIDWFETKSFIDLKSIPQEVNLISEYETSKTGSVDFYLEPGEVYHLGATIILPGGDYLTKVTFIGLRDFEFWRRLFHIRVTEA